MNNSSLPQINLPAMGDGFDKPAYNKFITDQGKRVEESMPHAKPSPVRVMLDLETWGTAPGSAIASIGAVRFDDTQIIDGFYCRVDVSSCLKVGMKTDFNTIQWWLEQSEEARQEMAKKGGVPITDALKDFSTWISCNNPGKTAFQSKETAELWGNGAAFDNALLSEAYRLCGIEQPWKFWNDRCYRTMKNEFPQVKMQARVGTHHNALDDAKSQALHLIEILAAHRKEYCAIRILDEEIQMLRGEMAVIGADLTIANAELATAKGELERMQEKISRLQAFPSAWKAVERPSWVCANELHAALQTAQDDPAQQKLPLEQTWEEKAEQVAKVLKSVNPDCGYAEWVNNARYVKSTLGDLPKALDVFLAWSACGREKYVSVSECKNIWASIKTQA